MDSMENQRPTEALQNTQSTSNAVPTSSKIDPTTGKKRRNHRGGKKKRNRRQSFAAPGQEAEGIEAMRQSQNMMESATSASTRPPMYRLGQSGGLNLSDTSLDSQALLDHRDHPPMRARRDSRLTLGGYGVRPNNASIHDISSPFRPGYSNPFTSNDGRHRRPPNQRAHHSSGGESDDNDAQVDSRTPLIATTQHGRPTSTPSNYGVFGGSPGILNRNNSGVREQSAGSGLSTRKRRGPGLNKEPSIDPEYDVNNPPSVPTSPRIGAEEDVLTGSLEPRSPEDRKVTAPLLGETLIDIDGDSNPFGGSSPPLPRRSSTETGRRRTMAVGAEGDVCFPLEGMSEMADEDYHPNHESTQFEDGPRRRRSRRWPELTVLDEWSWEEKEVRSEGINRAKKINEPVLVGGRLRPQKNGWHKTEEDAPYRFTYFNEEFQSTIHSQTISELLQPGQTFRDLFIPDPPELSDDSSSEEDDDDFASRRSTVHDRNEMSPSGQSRSHTRHSSVLEQPNRESTNDSGHATPSPLPPQQQQQPGEKPKRYGARPTFWLDVLSPTEAEMRVISKTFGIHPLTAEDILMQEAREKVELFRNYYFVNYRTFEQDVNSADYLEPINMYVVVFREGVISFHFSQTPHPANVRRRIRQLKDYLILSSDWISYAIIDDITDVFAPLIQSVEEEVDDIDDAILKLHANPESNETEKPKQYSDKQKTDGSESGGEQKPSGGDMLRRVGEGRKKVMGLYRLLGNKADVIKGFAKRCNEQWEIAPRSEIGLYLGDIQDHILTMTSNLSHYETLLSRAHSNYLAQINIRMNERQEQTADVLGKLTVLGTIVLPMNIVTGMWGMNVMVPGQGVNNLWWFWSISGFLLVFGVSCFFIAKRVYGIV
ncbi:MAG: CorA metal ion transporter [Icmadophila ericetorum]|nr:CorA metal ion transporter [Icmadophila ericetorum]